MQTRKFLSAVLALIMVLTVIPVFAFAEEVDTLVHEANMMNKMDKAGVVIETAEAEAMAAGMSRTEVINAVFEAALGIEDVDPDSFSDFSKDGFFFTVDGMYCAYNYRLRNELKAGATPDDTTIVVKGTGKPANGELKNAESPDALLVGPYYGYDSSFTNQYRNEIASIAEATGGDYTIIQGHDATGPAIAQNFIDKGVVIYDSHGTQSGTSSYLCLTTDDGITSEDYQNGWAVGGWGEAYIDGRYIQHHVSERLADCIVWMAICEGMKKTGHGTTGQALLDAGAGIVYGYSQSVTFIGDYMYEETFWNDMKEGATVAEAFEHMVDEHGVMDPYGDAYPIVMSPVDAFPDNPDAPQTVYCEWGLFGGNDPVELQSFSFNPSAVECVLGENVEVTVDRVPENANQYSFVWSSEDESVATVAGNNRKCTVTSVAPGTTNIVCEAYDLEGDFIMSKTLPVTISVDNALVEALNVDGAALPFANTGDYGFKVVESSDRCYAESNNYHVGNSTAALILNLEMKAGETLKFDYSYTTENNYDFFSFLANGNVELKRSGNSEWETYTFTADADGMYNFRWEYSKDSAMNTDPDCVRIDNVEYDGDYGPVVPDPEEVEFSVNAPATVKPGEEFNVTLDVAGQYDANILGAYINFDADVFEVVSASIDDYSDAIGNSQGLAIVDYTSNPGSIRLGAMANLTFDYTGTVIDATFRVKDNAPADEYEFECEITEFKYDDGINDAYSLPFNATNAYVTVEENDVPPVGEFEVVVDAPAREILVHDPNGSLYYNAADEYYIANASTITVRFHLPAGVDPENCFLQNAYDWWEPVYVSELPVENGWYVYTGNINSLDDPEMSYACTDLQFYIDQDYDPDTQWPDYIINFYKNEADLNVWCSDFEGVTWEYADGGDTPMLGDFDFDGEITIEDALFTIRVAMGLDEATDLQFMVADVNGDGYITVEDAMMIARVALGVDTF